MPRGRTQHVEEVREKILDRLQNGYWRAGDRFLSNRAAAQIFGVSYQTAHRLINELVAGGHLERRPQSGTYVPGRPHALKGVQLVFNERGKRPGSFGAHLLERLQHRLGTQGIDAVSCWAAQQALRLDRARLVVMWECPDVAALCAGQQHPAVLINDRPRQGMSSMFIDSVGIDDFSGGACAAEWLVQQTGRQASLAILAGPKNDPRSRQRVEGFYSVREVPVIWARGWYLEDGLKAAARAVKLAPGGLFCCNDRLAEGVVRHAAQKKLPLPAMIGFDNAPVSESLNLTTIAIPWDELVDGAVQIIRKRLSGDRAVSSRQIFYPRPLIRSQKPLLPASFNS